MYCAEDEIEDCPNWEYLQGSVPESKNEETDNLNARSKEVTSEICSNEKILDVARIKKIDN